MQTNVQCLLRFFDNLPLRLAWVFFVIIGFLVYGNTLFNDFVWDDRVFILENPALQSFDIVRFFTTDFMLNTTYYRPLFGIYFSLLHTFFGQSEFFYHFFQIVIHIVNTGIVFFLYKRFLKNSVAFFLSIIFLVHPINVESVAFISNTLTVLFFLFGILALYISQSGTLSYKKIFIINFFILISLFSRETGILFIPLILFSEYIFKKKQFLLLLTSTSVTIVVYFFIRFANSVYFPVEKVIPIMRLSFLERLSNIPEILFYYFKTFFFPNRLAIDQQWIIPGVTITHFYFPLTMLVMLSILLFLFGKHLYLKEQKRFRIFLFFLYWFILGMSLHIQIFPLDMTVAERWFYFPIVGILGIIGLGLEQISFFRKKIVLTMLIGTVIVLLLSIRTIVRNENWKNNMILYTHDMAIMNNYDLENNLGLEYWKMGKVDEAENHFKKSIFLGPFRWTNWRNLGGVYETKGEYKKAERMYLKSLENNPHYNQGYVAYAHLLVFHYNLDKTESYIRNVLAKIPFEADLWTLLSLTEYKKGNHDEAIYAAQRAYMLKPNQENYYLYSRLSQNLPVEIK